MGAAAPEEVVLAERDPVVAEREHDRVVQQVALVHLVHQPADPLVDRLHVLHVALAHPVDVVAAEVELHEPAVHAARCPRARPRRA